MSISQEEKERRDRELALRLQLNRVGILCILASLVCIAVHYLTQ